MRRIIIVVVTVVCGWAPFAKNAAAQPFRPPVRVVQPVVPRTVQPFSPFVRPFAANNFTTYQTPRGVFAPAIPGIYNPASGTFNPSFAGSSALISRGVFMPTAGTFVPTPKGNMLLATRQIYNPRTGRFEMSPTGPYTFATQGKLISSTTGDPVPVGLRGLGRLNPLNPITQFEQSWWAHHNALMTNPYFAGVNPYSVSPFAMTPPANYYSPQASYGGYGGGYGGYGGGYGGYGGGSPYSLSYNSGAYGNQSYGAAPYAQNTAPAIPAYTPSAPAPKQDAGQAAYGLPNEGGAAWPLAFRLMGPKDKRDLLDKFEAQYQVVVAQSASGNVNPVVLNEARHSLEELQQWLKKRRYDFAEGTYRDADELLKRLDKTLKTMSY